MVIRNVWLSDSATRRYKCEVLYVSAMPDKKDPSTELRFENPGGYSLYNPLEDTVVLCIPPTLAAGADTGTVTGKKRQDKSWSAKFLATSKKGYAFPAVYCGYAPGRTRSAYPLAPTFETTRIFLYDRSLGKTEGHYIADDAREGVARELLISNSSDSTELISYRFETVGAFPDGYSPTLFDNASKRFSSSGTITAGPRSTVSRWVVVGDKQWRDGFAISAKSFRYGLHRLYPNPARSVVTIGYSVPFGAKERVCITIFDLHGRKVWEKRIEKLLAPGNHLIAWNGRDRHNNAVGAGMYLVRLAVITASGKTVRRFEKCLTYFP